MSLLVAIWRAKSLKLGLFEVDFVGATATTGAPMRWKDRSALCTAKYSQQGKHDVTEITDDGLPYPAKKRGVRLA
jgi:hypothetical protein